MLKGDAVVMHLIHTYSGDKEIPQKSFLLVEGSYDTSCSITKECETTL